MIDIEKFLISLRNNKDHDGKLKPIYLADTVQEEIKIIQAAVENLRRGWVGLTDEEYDELMISGDWGGSLIQATEAKLKEKNT